jgi:hypothetical protein
MTRIGLLGYSWEKAVLMLPQKIAIKHKVFRASIFILNLSK